MHNEWKDHRSTGRFIDSVTSTLQSGVLRGRQDEVTAITAFAAAIVGGNPLRSTLALAPATLNPSPSPYPYISPISPLYLP